MKKRTKIIVIGCLCLLLAGVLAGIRLLTPSDKTETAEVTSGVKLDKRAVEYSNDVSDEPEDSDPSLIRVPGYPDVTISEVSDEIPIVLVNPQGNPCYFQFLVTIEETGEQLLLSDWVEPGMAIEGIALQKPLKAGDYQLLLNISTSSLSDGGLMNSGNIKTELHVTA